MLSLSINWLNKSSSPFFHRIYGVPNALAKTFGGPLLLLHQDYINSLFITKQSRNIWS